MRTDTVRKKKPADINSLVYDYLSEGISFSEGLSIPQTKVAYLLALKDYFEGKLNLNEIQSIAISFLYSFQKTPTDIWVADSELGAALDDASDIVYYHERRGEDPYNKKIYQLRRDSMKSYFEKNKSILDKAKENIK